MDQPQRKPPADPNYRPWRAETGTPLAEDAMESWRKMLADSRKAITQLRELQTQADQRLSTGSRLLRVLQHQFLVVGNALKRILRIESRVDQKLQALERRLDRIEMILGLTTAKTAPKDGDLQIPEGPDGHPISYRHLLKHLRQSNSDENRRAS